MTGAPLLARVRALVADVARSAAGGPFAAEVEALAARLDEPLRVAVAGRVKAGKSTLLNALVGQELAPTDAGECTRIVTWYRDGHTYRVVAEGADGPAVQVPFGRDGGALQVDLSAAPVPTRRLVVEWPSASLRAMTLIDTPGIGSTSRAGAATVAALAPEGAAERPADAVLYLMRHLHGEDVSFLEAFHDDTARAAPVNAIGVLSRADEIGAGRLDAMGAAGRIADRYRADPGVRRLCQTVVPVAGLVAQAAVTLTERDVDALRRLAAAPADDAEALLLSADRFRSAPTAVPIVDDERARMLDRLGLHGIRVGVALVAGGTATAPALAAALARHSGLDRLRRLLAAELTARGDVLKARSVLLGLERVLRSAPDGAGTARLLAELERVRAGAHELAELRVLTALRAGAIPLDDDAAGDAERLLATGRPVADRLGVAADAPAEEVRVALAGALDRWQRRAEHPLSSPPVVDAARVVVRTCEGMAAAAGRVALAAAERG